MSLELVILVYIASLAFLIAEVFVPGGALGFLGAIGLVTSIYFGFAQHGNLIGIIQIAVGGVLLPIAFYLALRRLALKRALKTEEGFRGETLGLDQLLGKEGTTLTNLRPAGTARIEGHKVDVVTEGDLIPSNQPVKVIRVEGNRVVVRSFEKGGELK